MRVVCFINGISKEKMKKRNYTQEDVKRLHGSLKIKYTLARRGATKLRELLATEPFVPTVSRRYQHHST